MNQSMILRGLLRLGAALMLSATLAACGSGSDDDDTPSDGGPPDTSVPEPAKPELRCAP